MKPTVSQLYQAAATIMSGMFANQYIAELGLKEVTDRAIKAALVLADNIHVDERTFPSAEDLKTFLVEVFSEVKGRPIAKYTLSNMLQTYFHIGRREAEQILFNAEKDKVLAPEVLSNGIRYTLA